VAENYIDHMEQKTLADVTRVVSNTSSEIETQAKLTGQSERDVLLSDKGQSLLKDLKSELKDQKKKIDRTAELIANHELYNAQNFGAFDGILHAARSIGIEDPTIIKIGVLDQKRCKHCWRLWTQADQKTPRAYKLSELSASSGDPKNPDPSISPTHPNCRDVIVSLFPGFGFDADGKIAYKGIDPDTNKPWDEHSKQRSQA
jgi:hypothetical protein